ncbi:MAG: hypothetical protein FJ100_21870 [Deltaproteobacteria bacterium]|nr:hypothetical protein [Deltaproteobacteria bacterium]
MLKIRAIAGLGGLTRVGGLLTSAAQVWLAVACASGGSGSAPPTALPAFDGGMLGDGHVVADAADVAGKVDASQPDVPADTTATVDAVVADAAAVDAASDAGSADVTPPPAPVPLAEFPSASAVGVCKANFTTCSPADKMPYATEQGCVATQVAGNAATLKELAAMVADGKLTYDAVAAGACIAALKETCDGLDLVTGPPPCQQMYQGSLKDGAACNFNVECASHYCYGPENCPRFCKKRVALGGVCGKADLCVAGAVCFGGKCVANVLKDVGAACGELKCKKGLYCNEKEKCAPLNKAGQACDLSGSCVPGSQCIDSGTGGSCQPMPKSGEPCSPNPFSDASVLCAAGLICFHTGGDDGTCKPKAAIGGPCTNTSDCGGWDMNCFAATAGGTKTCQLLPSKGGACQPGDLAFGQWSGCLDPYTCSSGVCIDVPKAGEPCAADLLKPCVEDAYCNFLTTMCEAMPGQGEKCFGICQTGLVCDEAVKPAVCKPAPCK